MKPLKLTMSAFGSYGGVEEIDFTALENGIFLITGDTGAGKTTIFDAISFALFGEVSGGARDGSMMRSHYASEDEETYVEMVFEERGEFYCVRRSPAYERISKRKNKDGEYKKVAVSAKASLTMADGSEFPGNIRDINQKIQELIGVDREQFAQITMIAQGEYLKLLHASSRERKLIFSKIFQTGIYGRIQLRLKEEFNRLYGQLEDNRKLVEHERKNVAVSETSAFCERWRELENYQETQKEQVLDVLKQVVAEAKEQEQTLKNRREQILKQQTALEIQLNQAEEVNGLFGQYAACNQKLKLLEDRAGEIKKTQDMLGKARKAEKVRIFENTYREMEQSYQVSEQKKRQLAAQIEQKKEQLLWAKKCVLAAAYEKWKEAEKQYKENREKLALLQMQFEAADEEYNRRYRLFLKVQAGILAQDLVDGSPCPVCGSFEHPNKAKVLIEDVRKYIEENAKENTKDNAEGNTEGNTEDNAEENTVRNTDDNAGENTKEDTKKYAKGKAKESIEQIISQEWVEKARENREKLEKTRLDATEDCIRSKEAYHQLDKKFHDQVKKWENVVIELSQREIQYASQDTRENDLGNKFIQSLEAILNKSGSKYTESDIDALLETVQTLEGNLQAEAINTKEKKGLLSEKKSSYDQAWQAEGFETEEAYFEQKKFIDQIDKWDQTIRRYDQEMIAEKARKSSYEEQIRGKQPVDVTAWKEELKQLRVQQSEVQRQEISAAAARKGNQQVLKNLKELWNCRETLEKEYTTIRTLYQTANGKLSGTAGVDFQTFVQRRYFNQMIQAANRRLKYMTDGQFILQCRQMDALGKQGEVGLDLDVYSVVTGKTRDVKTLSGGESFMAALSMALGMADIIQNMAGNVRVDTMFLDEGFGSLDDDARLRAIRILQDLAGDRRSIGIISHVTELKEQIEWKLVVKKDEKGSRIFWEGLRS